MRVGFAGLSHLGIISSACAASKGFDVVAYDPDAGLCAEVGRGQPPITEPGLAELFAASCGRLQVTSAPDGLRACDLVVLASDVPTDAEHRSDLVGIRRLLDTMQTHTAPEAVLVILSQVPPGFTREAAEALQAASPDRPRRLWYQVETLIFGQAVERGLKPERFIVGCAQPSDPLPDAYAQYLAVFGCPILRMRYESAELAKMAINMLLVSSLSTTNTLSELCEAIGADWTEIAPALALDRRIGPHAYLKPGLGFAGGNLDRDLATISALAQAHGTDIGIVEAWRSNSAHRRQWALTALHREALSQCVHPRIAVWGLAYKAHTASTKHSPAVDLLQSLHPFEVRVYDPCASLDGAAGVDGALRAPSALDACQGADALAIMTPWPEFSQVPLRELKAVMRGRVLVDPFGVLDEAACSAQGFRYARLGTPAREPMMAAA